MTDLRVVDFPTGNFRDIPAALEVMAKLIREGVLGDVVSGAGTFLRSDGSVVVCGWGDTSDVHSIGLLTLGAEWLAARRVVRT
jgi:hypothetical protein